VSSFGVGYDYIDAAEAGRRGVMVTNTPDVLTDEVADLTVGLLIATVRQLPQVDRYLREGRWLEKRTRSPRRSVAAGSGSWGSGGSARQWRRASKRSVCRSRITAAIGRRMFLTSITRPW
jgi:hypothetical protein